MEILLPIGLIVLIGFLITRKKKINITNTTTKGGSKSDTKSNLK